MLVTSTVKDLVAGSGLTFEDRGSHELKGIPRRMATLRRFKSCPRYFERRLERAPFASTRTITILGESERTPAVQT